MSVVVWTDDPYATVVDVVDLITQRLRADQLLQVFPGTAPANVPDTERPFVELYPDPGTAVRQRIAGGARTIVWNLRSVVSAPTPDAALWAVDHVRALLTDWRPIADQSSSPLNEADSGAELLIDNTADLANSTYSFTLHHRMHLTRSSQA